MIYIISLLRPKLLSDGTSWMSNVWFRNYHNQYLWWTGWYWFRKCLIFFYEKELPLSFFESFVAEAVLTGQDILFSGQRNCCVRKWFLLFPYRLANINILWSIVFHLQPVNWGAHDTVVLSLVMVLIMENGF